MTDRQREVGIVEPGREWSPLVVDPDGTGAPATPEGLLAHLSGVDLDRLLVDNGALVFRGFGIEQDGVDAVFDELLPNRLAYLHGNSPRTKVGDNLYTSTEYPSEYTISMHNELSYSHVWPSRLAFLCRQAPETGGATPVVDGATWLASLDDDLRTAFSDGVRYVQNLHGGVGLGKSWQDTFETADRATVEEFLASSGAEWEWGRGDALRVTQDRPATVRHPVTGAEVWFNQADQWHPASLGDETARAMAEIMEPDELPQSVTLADGSPVPDEWAVQIRDRGLDAAVDVDWAAGDLMVIDNVLVGHGRRPFTGPRSVLVAMSG